jgi:hypothetical protein
MTIQWSPAECCAAISPAAGDGVPEVLAVGLSTSAIRSRGSPICPRTGWSIRVVPAGEGPSAAIAAKSVTGSREAGEHGIEIRQRPSEL